MASQGFCNPEWNDNFDGTAIANSTAEALIFANKTILGGFFKNDRRLKIRASGKFSTITGPPTLRFRLRFGGLTGTVLADSGTITTRASMTNGLWIAELEIHTRANGAAGSLYADGFVSLFDTVAPTIGSATGAAATAAMTAGGISAPAPVTGLDLTVDTPLSLTAQWSAANAGNTLTGLSYYGDSPN